MNSFVEIGSQVIPILTNNCNRKMYWNYELMRTSPHKRSLLKVSHRVSMDVALVMHDVLITSMHFTLIRSATLIETETSTVATCRVLSMRPMISATLILQLFCLRAGRDHVTFSLFCKFHVFLWRPKWLEPRGKPSTFFPRGMTRRALFKFWENYVKE